MKYTLVSANSHLIEPSHVFEGRLPARWAQRAPVIRENAAGKQYWAFEDVVRPLLLSTASVGTPKAEWATATMIRYEDMRPGCFDPVARLADMDIDGVWATACYSSPSGIGFGGDLFFYARDVDLGHAAMRAWNDWYHEEWIAVAPDRFIPVGCTSYADPDAAAVEVRRNAARGFKGVMFRNPTDLGLPWVGTGYWDPFFRACEETQTVIVHHTSVIDTWPRRAAQQADGSRGLPYGLISTMWQSIAIEILSSWLWGGVGVRFPGLRVTIAESGGSWLPHLIQRLDFTLGFSPLHARDWPAPGRSAADMIAQTFTFSTVELDVALQVERDFGIGGWMLEDDYPHMESVWPDTQAELGAMLDLAPAHRRQALAWENAARLFRHPVPAGLMPETDRQGSGLGGSLPCRS